jgi:hypothetical protein
LRRSLFLSALFDRIRRLGDKPNTSFFFACSARLTEPSPGRHHSRTFLEIELLTTRIPLRRIPTENRATLKSREIQKGSNHEHWSERHNAPTIASRLQPKGCSA